MRFEHFSAAPLFKISYPSKFSIAIKLVNSAIEIIQVLNISTKIGKIKYFQHYLNSIWKAPFESDSFEAGWSITF